MSTPWSAAEQARWLRQARAKRGLPDYDRPQQEGAELCRERGCEARVDGRNTRCALHRARRAEEKRRARDRKRYARQTEASQ